MNEKKAYIYLDGGYEFLSLHRKVKAFDPRNTDNLIILDYFHTIRKNRDISSIYHKLIENDMENYRSSSFPSIPISFQMVYHEINMAWVDIIHQMVFIDNAYETFCAQYGKVIMDIISHGDIKDKESLVYRYYGNGETIFHVAGKIWLINKYFKNMDDLGYSGNMIYDELKQVLTCYEELGKRLPLKGSLSILFTSDYNGNTVERYLRKFADEIKENKIGN